MKTLLALLLLIPSLSLGKHNPVDGPFGEHNPVAVELRAKIEKEFREAGYYNRTKFEEYIYQRDLEEIEKQKRIAPNNSLTELNEEMFKEKEEWRIFNITKKILENNYFKIKDELANTNDLENKKLLEVKLKEAKKIYTLYAFGDEYEMSECWENRNCKPIPIDTSSIELKLPENYIYVEPPSVYIYIE